MKALLQRARHRHLPRAVRPLLALSVLAGLLIVSSSVARADGTFISAPGRFDFVHDLARGLVYISSGPQVLRYRLSDATFLDPIPVSGRARGLDISPDGNTLLIADGAPFADPAGSSQSYGRIVFVNLGTLAQTSKTFLLIPGEVGPYSLAFDCNGNALISPGVVLGTDPSATTKAPLHRYLAASDSVGTIGEWGTSNPPLLVAPRTVVAANNDGTALGFAETGSPTLDWGIAGIWSGAVQRFSIGPATNGTAARSLDIATNGTTWFLPTLDSALVRSGQNDPVSTVGASDPTYNSTPYGVAIDSARALTYISRKGSGTIDILNAKTLAPVASVNAEQAVLGWSTPFGNGHLRVSKSGTLLMESQTDGVRLFPLQNGLPSASFSLSTPEDTPVPFTLPNPFPASASVSYSLFQSPRYGWIDGTLPGATYTPYGNFNGSDSFVYTVSDGITTQTLTVPVTVSPVDDPFIAQDMSQKTRIGLPTTLYLSAWDADDRTWWLGGNDNPPRYPLEIVTPPAHGTLVIDATNTYGNSWIYTPEAGFEGTDTFTYRGVKPATGEKSSLGTGTITVSGAAPVARDDKFLIRSSSDLSSLYVGAPGILANDSSAERYFSLYSASNLSDGGRIWMGSDGAIAYYPPAGQKMATDKVVTFQYQFWDGVTQSNLATVTLDIKPFLSAPSLPVYGTEDTPMPVALAGTGIAPLSYRVVSQPYHGTLSGNAPNLVYTPFPNFDGSDSFTYQVIESGGAVSGIGTVSLFPKGVNDAPVASNQTFNILQDAPVLWTPSAMDVDSPTLSFRVVTGPANGTVAFDTTKNGWYYTPTPGFVGSDSFTYVANDGSLDSAPATVSISVAHVNAAPVATMGDLSTDEDTSKTFSLSGTDKDGDALTFSVVTPPLNGTLSGTAPNLTYTPKVNWNGTDSLRYRVSDGQASVDRTIKVVVAPVNDAPVAGDQNVSLNQDTTKTIALAASDIDSTTLSFSVVTATTNGKLSGTGANLSYTPNAGFVGTDSFSFKAGDGALDSNTATVSLSVAHVNHDPIAQAQSVSLDRDTSKTITLVASDPDGDPLSFGIDTRPTNGKLSGTGPDVVYTPNPGFVGSDSFLFYASDGRSSSWISTVSITVNAVNHAPVAQGQTLALDEDNYKTIALRATDFENSPLTYSIVDQPQHGILVGKAPNVTYSPAQDWNGSDSFTFKVNDGALDSTTVTIALNVAPINDAPVAKDTSAGLYEDSSTSITLRATDVDSPNLTYSVVTQPKNGVLSGTAPNLTYTPNANWNGQDSFSFKANDGLLDSNTATVSLTIYPVNDAPVAQDQSVTLDQDTSKALTLGASDIDSPTLTYSIVTPPKNGTLGGTAPNLVYTPKAGYRGSDSFTFKANDGAFDSNTATVSITVNAVNHVPVAAPQSLTLDQNTSKTLTMGASDPDGDAVTFEIVTAPTKGTLSGTGASRTYTPNAGFVGADSFSFRASDGTLSSSPATVSIAVLAVNRAPVAQDGSASTSYNTPVNFALSASDADGDALTFSIAAAPTKGTLSGSGATRVYTPTLGTVGFDSFTFRASDGRANSNTATFTLNIAGQPPTATAGSSSVLEDATATIALGGTALNGATIAEWAIVANPVNGTLSGSGNSRTYAPARDFFGSDAFTFRVRDSRGVWSAPATVSVSVAPVNDAPSFLLPNINVSAAKNALAQSIAGFATAISAGPPNENSQTVSFVCTNSNASLFSTQPTIAANGTLSFRVANGRTGTATVQVVIVDSGGTANGGQNQSQAKTFSIRVG